jgi:capsular exopolysaccharide synthesis family protein
MSHIFDALQRSEAERFGIDGSALSTATELLLRVERRATSKWETERLPERFVTSECAEHDKSFAPQAEPSVASALGTSVASGPSQAGERVEGLGQCQSLQISFSAKSRLASLADNEGPAAESFRFLAVKLRHLRRDRPLKKLLITSTIPQEGKSMVAANLACALALGTQLKILLLEGDLRRPSLMQVFGLGRLPGLCQCLQGEHNLTASIYHFEGMGLWILPAGSSQSNPLELLQSRKMSALMDQLTEWFDWIVIDSPPVLPLADTSLWTRLADGILLVTRQGVTKKRELQRGLEAIEQKKLLGALLNSCKHLTSNDYYYGRPALSQTTDSTNE